MPVPLRHELLGDLLRRHCLGLFKHELRRFLYLIDESASIELTHQSAGEILLHCPDNGRVLSQTAEQVRTAMQPIEGRASGSFSGCSPGGVAKRDRGTFLHTTLKNRK